jgi:predicted site-specific integrase-resolvase
MTSTPDFELIGYRGATACSAAGISYRQLDYWARTGLVEPSIRASRGIRVNTSIRFQRHLGSKDRKAFIGCWSFATEHPNCR